jgi:hypothetical protein
VAPHLQGRQASHQPAPEFVWIQIIDGGLADNLAVRHAGDANVEVNVDDVGANLQVAIEDVLPVDAVVEADVVEQAKLKEQWKDEGKKKTDYASQHINHA